MLYKQNEAAIKSVGTRKIKGTGIRFGSEDDKDWDGEWFHTDTELGLKNGSSRPYIMEHGYSSKFGMAIVGEATYEKAGEGWEYEAVFTDSAQADKAYNEIIAGAYKSSAGAASHTRRASIIKGTSRLDVWLVAEQSATMFPADSGNPRVTRTKSDYILHALKEMHEEHEGRIKEILEAAMKDGNEARTKLADALTSLKESFTNGEPFVVTEEFLSEIEQVTKPIAIIGLN
jgi:hypothetical protein